jgi:hypothetical protein
LLDLSPIKEKGLLVFKKPLQRNELSQKAEAEMKPREQQTMFAYSPLMKNLS